MQIKRRLSFQVQNNWVLQFANGRFNEVLLVLYGLLTRNPKVFFCAHTSKNRIMTRALAKRKSLILLVFFLVLPPQTIFTPLPPAGKHGGNACRACLVWYSHLRNY